MQSPVEYRVRLADGRDLGPAAMDVLCQWAREGRVPQDALLTSTDGQVRSVLSEPALKAILQAPPTVSTGLALPATAEGEAPLSGMIPYKNPPALVGYYAAIVSLCPIIGGLAGPAAMILGIVGLRRRMKEPLVRGLAHAWIAIIGGLIGTLITVGCIGSAILGNMNRP